MKRYIVCIGIIVFGLSHSFGQDKIGIIFSGSVEAGNLISGHDNPRSFQDLRSHKFVIDYQLVTWKHTVMRLGTGYQYVSCEDTNLDYILFPILFQRFINAEKTGFNSSFVIYPGLNVGNRSDFCNNPTSKFHIQLAARAGIAFKDGNHKLNAELELATIMDTIRKNSSLKFLTYGVRISYVL